MSKSANMADDYAEATDGCRYLIPPTSRAVRQAQWVKPDPETNPWAILDWKEWATLGDEPWFWSD